MKTVRTRYLLLSALILMLCAQGLQAQAPLEPAQLPANTTFYFIWRGQPSAELKKSNSIAALWDDPDFAPVRSSLTRALLKNSEEKSDAEKSKEPRLTREQLEQYATLLENPFVFGYLSDPNKKHSEASAQAKQLPGKESFSCTTAPEKKPSCPRLFSACARTRKRFHRFRR
jgi:hypothetical protein